MKEGSTTLAISFQRSARARERESRAAGRGNIIPYPQSKPTSGRETLKILLFLVLSVPFVLREAVGEGRGLDGLFVRDHGVDEAGDKDACLVHQDHRDHHEDHAKRVLPRCKRRGEDSVDDEGMPTIPPQKVGGKEPELRPYVGGGRQLEDEAEGQKKAGNKRQVGVGRDHLIVAVRGVTEEEIKPYGQHHPVAKDYSGQEQQRGHAGVVFGYWVV